MSPASTRAGVLRELVQACRALGLDELRVLTWIARRLVEGRAQYGELDLATDPRDFRHERAEELADALVYSACDELRRVALS